MSRFIELSHEIVPGMTTYPGLPEPTVDVVVDYEASRPRYQNKAEFFIASPHLCGNTGTYVDSPRHRYRDGADLAGLSLERLANLPTLVIDATQAGRAIGSDTFSRWMSVYRTAAPCCANSTSHKNHARKYEAVAPQDDMPSGPSSLIQESLLT